MASHGRLAHSVAVNRSRAVVLISIILSGCLANRTPERDGVELVVIVPYPVEVVLLGA